ncbi:YceG family protein [Clostridium hydrogenum]|uniref:YceG family protein n=1 Tax=Clostridium hydrogenum TaxID=2855764 RepID=UPI001F3A4720|nr:YceG family protein [Clostridium hydrogenum]
MSSLNEEKNTSNARRTETDAFRATKEFKEMFHDKESFYYEPWQFADYEVCADTLKTTYDEIGIWGKQEAVIRPGWKVSENTVYIPNLFSKIVGVYSDVVQYREDITAILKEKDTLFFKHFPLFHRIGHKKIGRIYSSLLNRNGEIDKNKLLTSKYWKYTNLKSGLQENIAEKIIEFCKLPDFWKYKCFSSNIKLSIIDKVSTYITYMDNKIARDETLMKISTLSILLNLDAKLLSLLQNFDYPLHVPKIVTFNNSYSGTFSFSDAVTLMFMNSLGIDIIMYNPGATSDIENFVKEDYFDIHRLQFTNSKIKYKRVNFFIRLFRKLKSRNKLLSK